MNLTTQFHLVSRLITRGAVPLLPSTCLCGLQLVSVADMIVQLGDALGRPTPCQILALLLCSFVPCVRRPGVFGRLC
jgi:hypothetical protein